VRQRPSSPLRRGQVRSPLRIHPCPYSARERRHLQRARRRPVTNCSFAHLGGAALVVANSSQRVDVIGNTFSDVSCGGLRVGQVDNVLVDGPRALDGRRQRLDNLFTDVAVEYRDCSGARSSGGGEGVARGSGKSEATPCHGSCCHTHAHTAPHPTLQPSSLAT